MQLSDNQQAFLALVRAGLWEKDVQLSSFGNIDYTEVHRLSDEQSVLGLVAAGFEHITDLKVPREVSLMYVGEAMQIEQRNLSMNRFLEDLIKMLSRKNIDTLLLKGQGIAQCYEKPLWRSNGDIDLLLSKDNYQRAGDLLKPLASSVSEEYIYSKHLAMTITPWLIELHGTLRSNLCKRVDCVLDELQCLVLYKGHIRPWMNGHTQIFMPGIEENVIFVFSHILEHYFRAGIGYRQICDWCRLLYKNRASIDVEIIEARLNKMKLITEWKAFASLAVNYLGMPEDSMPFYSSKRRWKVKADRINTFLLEVGNFGHNRDYSYFSEHSTLVRKWITFRRILKDSIRQTAVFPFDAPLFFLRYLKDGVVGLFRS